MTIFLGVTVALYGLGLSPSRTVRVSNVVVLTVVVLFEDSPSPGRLRLTSMCAMAECVLQRMIRARVLRRLSSLRGATSMRLTTELYDNLFTGARDVNRCKHLMQSVPHTHTHTHWAIAVYRLRLHVMHNCLHSSHNIRHTIQHYAALFGDDLADSLSQSIHLTATGWQVARQPQKISKQDQSQGCANF